MILDGTKAPTSNIIHAFRKRQMFEQAYETHSTDVLFLALFTSIGENNSSRPGNFFGTKIIWVPVPSHFRDQTYLSPSPIPLLGPKLFESRSRPIFGTKLIWVPVPSRFRDQTYLSPSPVPLTGPERAKSRSRSRTTKAGPAELCKNISLQFMGTINICLHLSCTEQTDL